MGAMKLAIKGGKYCGSTIPRSGLVQHGLVLLLGALFDACLGDEQDLDHELSVYTLEFALLGLEFVV